MSGKQDTGLYCKWEYGALVTASGNGQDFQMSGKQKGGHCSGTQTP